MNKKCSSFTLIELLVVIAIIGILSGLIIVGMNGITASASMAKAKVFSTSLRDSLAMSLISEWKFDGTTADGSPATANDVLDTWSRNNNGTLSATPPTVRTGSNCVTNSCLQFDGTSNYISFSFDNGIIKSTNLSGGYTLEVWAKSNPQSGSEKIILGRLGYHGGILASSNNYVFQLVKIGGSPYYDINVANTNNWQYLVAVYDNYNMKFYSNGIKIPTEITIVSLNNYNNNFYIGGETTGSYNFSGLIDMVRVYNAAMSVSEIQEQYYAGLTKLLAKGEITKEECQNRVAELKTKMTER